MQEALTPSQSQYISIAPQPACHGRASRETELLSGALARIKPYGTFSRYRMMQDLMPQAAISLLVASSSAFHALAHRSL